MPGFGKVKPHIGLAFMPVNFEYDDFPSLKTPSDQHFH
jgi:hypothetical protein